MINKTNHNATLSQTVLIKAGIAVFELADGGGGPGTNPGGYIHAQPDEKAIPRLLDERRAIDFDRVISRNTLGIVTRSGDAFHLNRNGVYLVTWEISVIATKENAYAALNLEVGGSVHSKSYMPLPIGVLFGSAVIRQEADLAEGPVPAVRLVNASGDTVQISEYSTITITQVVELP